MVSGEYDSIGSKCCKIKSTRHDFHSPISWKPQSPSCHLRRRDFLFNFRFVLHDENAWTKRRKWAGGFNGEYEIAAERNRRDRWTDAVRDVICYVTPLKCQFLGPRMETKKLQSCSERYGGAQAVAKVIAKSPCEWQKHFAPLSGRPKDPGLVTQEHRGAHPARHLALPALLIVAPSFIFSVALEGNKLTNRTATRKATWGLELSWPWESFIGHDDDVL